MNDNNRDEWSHGRLEHIKRALPPAPPTDCSGWESDIPTGQWSVGRLENVLRALMPVAVDCSAWDAPAAEPQLTVSVQFEDGELTDSFVRAIQQADPTLRLERVPPTAIRLALPNQGALATLYGAFQGLQAVGCVIGSEHGAFRVRRKAS